MLFLPTAYKNGKEVQKYEKTLIIAKKKYPYQRDFYPNGRGCRSRPIRQRISELPQQLKNKQKK